MAALMVKVAIIFFVQNWNKKWQKIQKMQFVKTTGCQISPLNASRAGERG